MKLFQEIFSGSSLSRRCSLALAVFTAGFSLAAFCSVRPAASADGHDADVAGDGQLGTTD